MPIKPRNWQKKLIELISRRLIIGNQLSQDLLVHAGPGAGKTLGALLSFKYVKDKGLLEKFIVFCHRNSIINQWKDSARNIGLSLVYLDLNEENKIPKNVDGLIVTYQGVSRMDYTFVSKLRVWCDKNTLAIADEVHHLGIAPEEEYGPAWGKSFLEITINNRLRLGLTGTPFRADNLAFCSANKVNISEGDEIIEQISPDLCIEPRELILEGDVRPLEFHFQDGLVEHKKSGDNQIEFSAISSESRESWRARNLRRAISFNDENSIALNLLTRARMKLENIRLKHKNAAGLVIAKDIGHATAITNLLRENGDKVELIHSNEPKANDLLTNFENGNALWLVSVDMCAEGFDSPRLRVVAYLTTVATKSRFIQAITRAVRISPSREKLENIPRDPSLIFAPADPLLMEYARSWSIAKPYLIRKNNDLMSESEISWPTNTLSLPMEAINHQKGSIIRMRTLELPGFLKR